MGALRKLATAGLLGATTAGGYVAYLTYRYPIRPPSPYHTTPAMLNAYLDGQGTPEVVYARIHSPSPRQLASPRDEAVRTFFSAWALQIEGWLFGSKLHLVSPRPIGASDDPALVSEVYLGGFFQTLHKSPEATVLFWSFPGRGAPILHHAKRGRVPQGIQVVSAVLAPDGSGDLEVAYACDQYREPYGKEDGVVMGAVHHLYMRYLVERMRANMQAEARRG